MVTAHLFPFRLRLRSPFAIAHDTYTYRDTMIVRISSTRAHGHGEVPIVPYYNITRESAQHQCEILLSTLVDRMSRVAADREGGITVPSVDSMIALAEELEGQASARHAVDPHPFVAAGVSEALLDWTARLHGLTIARLLGVPAVRGRVCSYTIAEPDPDAAVALARRAFVTGGAESFPLKIKCGYENDVTTVAAIRDALPRSELWIDCNGGWPASEAVERARAMERHGVTLIEEPVRDDFETLQRLAASVGVPVIADESIASAGQVDALATVAPAVAGVVLKVAKLGGPMAFLAARRWLQETGRRFMVGEMVESGVGTAWALALADGASWVDLDAPVLVSNDPTDGLDAVPGRVQLVRAPATGTGVTVEPTVNNRNRQDEGVSHE